MRGCLSQKGLQAIDARLPKIDRRVHLATSQSPGVDVHDVLNRGSLGVALVCLEDAVHRSEQVRLALYEGYACLAWYLEESEKAPETRAAVHTGKFYVDYAAMLLYAAGEDIEAFIVSFLELEDYENYLADPNTQKMLKDKQISSNAAKVGCYMKDKYPNNQITRLIMALNNNPAWKETMKYRNTLTHKQPPIVEGLGIQYARKSRLVETENAVSMEFGGGSQSQYTANDLVNIVSAAFAAFQTTLSELAEEVIRRREAIGEKIDFDAGSFSIELFGSS